MQSLYLDVQYELKKWFIKCNKPTASYFKPSLNTYGYVKVKWKWSYFPTKRNKPSWLVSKAISVNKLVLQDLTWRYATRRRKSVQGNINTGLSLKTFSGVFFVCISLCFIFYTTSLFKSWWFKFQCDKLEHLFTFNR